ncbi:VOC family protein [Paenibacillus harenae]|uniref:VOC family protein n=1 Tax=Paenibacillus harenae TaxID=306543 RepID=UPI002793B005|nr:VOC family protein [Paenibacillus harenae]MDQ0061900.1 hypothetical protein [Paenibacillus harenae]
MKLAMIIERAEFLTAGPLEGLILFYNEILRFPIVAGGESGRITFQAGSSQLTFVSAESTEGKPYYHFAFNIPANKLDEAKAWISRHVQLGVEAGEDVSYSASWNSHSVYFADPAGNILELIARHTMDNEVDRPFDAEQDVLNISEIGLPAHDVRTAVDELEAIGIPTYKTRDDSFNPVGDDEGLFIIRTVGGRWHFTDKTAESFPIRAQIRGIGELYLYENGQQLVNRTK